MGTVWSAGGQPPSTPTTVQEEKSEEPEAEDLFQKRKLEREHEMEEFKRDLARRKEARLEALTALRNTVESLRKQNRQEEDNNRKLIEEKEAVEKRIATLLEQQQDEGKAQLAEELEEANLMLEQERLAKSNVEQQLLKTTLLLEVETKARNELIKQTESTVQENNRLRKKLQEAKEENANLQRTVQEVTDNAQLLEETAQLLDQKIILERKLEETNELLIEERNNNQEIANKLEEKTSQSQQLETQVQALKDVANIGKQILAIREKQVNELNMKLQVIEKTGAEYEKEVGNIKKLKALYEERARASDEEHRAQLERERARVHQANTQLSISRQETQDLNESNQYLKQKLEKLDTALDEAKDQISQLKIELATKGEHLYHATSQMAIVNTLFTQVLEGPDMDFDRLASLLEENHDLINELTAKGKMEEVASVLLEIAEPQKTASPHPSTPHNQGVKENLTKVWRVLVELLSHHHHDDGETAREGEDGALLPPESVSCYKEVETPRGIKTVISPSQTYIKLKDLILEKNSLVKEVGRLRTLNGHLEERLGRQQDRLSLVTEELHNTWAVVNQLRQQHKQLHNQEKILRFELKHKRLMLNELKKQLEICRDQWELARRKNLQTEEDWRILREEFAARKRKTGCGSGESGYEDEDTASPASELDDTEEEQHQEQGEEETRQPTEDLELEHEMEIELSIEQLQELLSIDEEPQLSRRDREREDTGRTSCFILQPDTTTQATGIIQQQEPTTPYQSPETNMEREVEEGSSIPTKELSSNQQREQYNEELFPSSVLQDITTTEEVKQEKHVNRNKTLEELESIQEEQELVGACCSAILQQGITTTEEQVREVRAPPSKRKTQELASIQEEHELVGGAEEEERGTASGRKRTAEEVLAGREARLKRLEEQCKSLFTQMNNTSARSDIISNKLEELHQHYNNNNTPTPPPPPPPPLPPTLLHTAPTIRPSRRTVTPFISYISKRFYN